MLMKFDYELKKRNRTRTVGRRGPRVDKTESNKRERDRDQLSTRTFDIPNMSKDS